MNKTATTLMLLAALLASTSAAADTLLRLRLIRTSPEAGSGPVYEMDVNGSYSQDLDASWFITPQLLAELAVGTPQPLDLSLRDTALGRMHQIPLIGMLQYRYPAWRDVQGYVGVGFNYTVFTDRKLDGDLRLQRSSTGPVLQLGCDVLLHQAWTVNIDIKKTWIDSDLFDAQGFVTHLNIDPLMAGIGLGYHFR
ncbi:MAG: OmpW family outer membrane protein [Pseudomonadota bacterium]